ncbi:hypothetical protein VPNG_09815 [Cytospora leucostoma]|uniref:Holocytochrome c-type synthase n=1 Tax=Cytospora leucostoma TaxID=1230097 RepID=A0A423VMD4_9PEZI|nr:hypothetical protein VPNG_09815 [Cytospora leucostoma]
MSNETGGIVGGNASAAAECPVDHKSREAWLAHAKAAQEAQSQLQSQATQSQTPPLQEQPHHSTWLPSLFSSNATSNNKDGPSPSSPPSAEDKCPVDHHSREAWLKQARAAQEAQTQSQQSQQFPLPAKSITPTSTSNESTKSSGWRWPRVPFLSSASTNTTTESSATTPTTTAQQPHPTKPHHGLHGLTTDREVSTIPRASAAGATAVPVGPSNHETETGADPKTGNWVYPSEKMFFEAMKRKGHDTRVADMKTVVPIHNAVNERAWKEIREWEKPYEATSCPQGPMLYSFMGLSTNMSPRARLNTLLGYTAPFDRHDWIIDRCGTKVEYVIDFYAGKPGAAGGVPSFFLDVRPKLNSWEGVKMRALRGVGLA